MQYKKLVSPLGVGAAPFKHDYFTNAELLMNRFIASSFAHLQTSNFVISGCNVTNITGSTCDISAGQLFFGNYENGKLTGEIVDFDGYSGAYPIYLNLSEPEFETKEFKDGIDRNYYYTYSVVANSTAINSSHNIYFNPDTHSRREYIEQRVNTSKSIALPFWFTGTLSNYFDASGLGKENTSLYGWAICNGQNGTPNYQGRTLVGYDSSDSDFNSVGKTGGQKSITLTGNQSGTRPHSHNVTDAGHTHTMNQTAHSHGATDSGHSHTASQAAHNHSASQAEHQHYVNTYIPNYDTTWYTQLEKSTPGAPPHRGVLASQPTINVGGTTGKAQPAISVANAQPAITVASGNANITVANAFVNITNNTATTGVTINNATAQNASEAHSNVQPYATVIYICRIA